ncbi:hypothetical protein ElyMa_001964200 [Elysia marginata]|uniref:Sushi domain-containing protein n=1 Tax=Elysia marginata TaxID=1093978 RepID=A0AAV4EZL6_9GAST|nr:hypothetical protein ElyMa_001964200 [Elysia marginata]
MYNPRNAKTYNSRYKCKGFTESQSGTINCRRVLSGSTDVWKPTTPSVCDFKCIAIDWDLKADYINFGHGPDNKTGEFCVQPSTPADRKMDKPVDSSGAVKNSSANFKDGRSIDSDRKDDTRNNSSLDSDKKDDTRNNKSLDSDRNDDTRNNTSLDSDRKDEIRKITSLDSGKKDDTRKITSLDSGRKDDARNNTSLDSDRKDDTKDGGSLDSDRKDDTKDDGSLDSDGKDDTIYGGSTDSDRKDNTNDGGSTDSDKKDNTRKIASLDSDVKDDTRNNTSLGNDRKDDTKDGGSLDSDRKDDTKDDGSLDSDGKDNTKDDGSLDSDGKDDAIDGGSTDSDRKDNTRNNTSLGNDRKDDTKDGGSTDSDSNDNDSNDEKDGDSMITGSPTNTVTNDKGSKSVIEDSTVGQVHVVDFPKGRENSESSSINNNDNAKPEVQGVTPDLDSEKNKEGRKPVQNLSFTEDHHETIFLLLSIACGVSVLVNIVCGLALCCTSRRTRGSEVKHSQPCIPESRGVENMMYVGHENEANLGSSRIGVDRISASEIGIAVSPQRPDPNVGASGIAFVNSGFNNINTRRSNPYHPHKKPPLSNTIEELKLRNLPSRREIPKPESKPVHEPVAVFYGNVGDLDSESGAQVKFVATAGDEPLYAVAREVEYDTPVKRPGQAGLAQGYRPRLNTPPEEAVQSLSSLARRTANQNARIGAAENEYVEQDSFWTSQAADIVAIPTFDDEEPRRVKRGSEVKIQFLRHSRPDNNTAAGADEDGVYRAPVSRGTDDVYSEI